MIVAIPAAAAARMPLWESFERETVRGMSLKKLRRLEKGFRIGLSSCNVSPRDERIE